MSPDVESLKSRDVSVGYTPGVLTDATAELTVSLLLATSRRLMEGTTALRSGAWAAWSPLWLCGPQLSGETMTWNDLLMPHHLQAPQWVLLASGTSDRR